MSIELALEQLLAFQAKANRLSARSWSGKEKGVPTRLVNPDYCSSRLMVADLGGALAVHYFGEDYGIPDAAFKLLAKQEIAEHIVSLRIDGPDQGANGTREWRFDPILKSPPLFPILRDFWIRPTATSDHNFSLVADGQLSPLLALMPQLTNVTVPNAPDAAFFDTPYAKLQSITIGMEWRTHHFVANLANATNCQELSVLDFSDSLAAFMTFDLQEPEWDSTPFEDYVALLKSTVGQKLRVLRLRNTRLTECQFQELDSLSKYLQLCVIVDAPHVYLSHWKDKQFPYRHVLPFG